MKNTNLRKILTISTALIGMTSVINSHASGKFSEMMSDAKMRAHVTAKLIRAKDLPYADISLHAYKHNVQLCGFMNSQQQIDKAEKVTKSIHEVKTVYNNMLLKNKFEQPKSGGKFVDDAVVTTRVKAKLLKTKGVPAHAISVETFHGAVQLCGFVKNEKEIDKAVELAKGVRDVEHVENNLIVANKHEEKTVKEVTETKPATKEVTETKKVETDTTTKGK